LLAEQTTKHLTSLVRRIAKRAAAQRRVDLAREWRGSLALR
jgi:hypothetical protein